MELNKDVVRTLRDRWRIEYNQASHARKGIIRNWIVNTKWALENKPRLREEYDLLVKVIESNNESENKLEV